MYTVSITFGFYDLSGFYSNEIGEYNSFKDAIEAFHNTEINDILEYKNFIKDVIREVEENNDNNADHIDASTSNEDDNFESDEDREELFNQLFMYSLLIEKDSEEIIWYDDWQGVRGFDENRLTDEEIKLLNEYGF
jgi:hypothetical protein